MEKYSVYLFDFDYTLGDATSGIVDSVNFALVEMNYNPANIVDVKKTIGMQLSDTYTYLTGDEKKENQMNFAKLFKQRADSVMLDNTKLFEDTENILRKLKEKNFKIAIITTKYHYRIVDILEKFNISSLVDVIVGGEDVKKAKPHPESMDLALKQLNISAKECIFIGDSLIDAQTAHNANIDFIGVTTGTTCENDFNKFPYIKIISRLNELFSI